MASWDAATASRRAGDGLARVCVHRARALLPTARRLKMVWWLARPSTVVGRQVGCQVSGLVAFSLSFCFCLLFFYSFGFSKNTKSFLLLLKIFMLSVDIIPEPLIKFQDYWTCIFFIKEINPIQIVYDLYQRPKINILKPPKILV